MTDGSRRTNRHGIPLHDGDPARCCWPQCIGAADRALKVPLCTRHAKHVYRTVNADLEREREVVSQEVAALDAAAKARRLANQVIYYAQIGGHIKIGWTSRLEQRMRAYPPNTTLLAVHPGTRSDERQLHRRFAVHRSHGQEWYPLVPVLLDHIKRVVAEHGEPPTVSFGAKAVEVRRPKDKPTLHTKNQATFFRSA